ncbi:MAG: exosortase/archaeosortase family protein [Paludibacteraceae bacterium]|nr:exosortase/archaeosortase family protein [Paludibacteraceae bacterium]
MPKRPSDIVPSSECSEAPLSIVNPYKDILLFVVALLLANGFWKLTVQGDELGRGDVTWLGIVLTPFFDWMSQQVAQAAYGLVALVRDTVHLNGTRLYFDSGNGSHIVWSCTPVKQSFIWLCLIAAARGKWLRKLWFIPLGWLLIYGINIVRIAAISLIIEHHPELFEVMHTYVFKYAFYGLMFLMWLVWVNHLSGVSDSGTRA